MATQRCIHLECSKTSGKVNLGFVLTHSLPRRLVDGLNGARSRFGYKPAFVVDRLDLKTYQSLLGGLSNVYTLRIPFEFRGL